MVQMKICKKCGVEKSLADYHQNKMAKDGHLGNCKSCSAAYSREWLRRNRHRARENGRRWRRANPEKTLSLAKAHRHRERMRALRAYGSKCACCSEARLEFLVLDHPEGGGLADRKKHGMGRSFYTWLKKQGYPAGLRVLCHNFNMG